MTPAIGGNRSRASSTRAIFRVQEVDPSSFKATTHQEDHQSQGQGEYGYRISPQLSNRHDGLVLTHSPTNASTSSTSTTTTAKTGTSVPSITISSGDSGHQVHAQPELPAYADIQVEHQHTGPLSSSVSLPEEVSVEDHREAIVQARQQGATPTSNSSPSPAGVRPTGTGTLSRAVAPPVGASAGAGANTNTTRLTGVTGTIPTVDQCTIRPERVSAH